MKRFNLFPNVNYFTYAREKYKCHFPADDVSPMGFDSFEEAETYVQRPFVDVNYPSTITHIEVTDPPETVGGIERKVGSKTKIQTEKSTFWVRRLYDEKLSGVTVAALKNDEEYAAGFSRKNPDCKAKIREFIQDIASKESPQGKHNLVETISFFACSKDGETQNTSTDTSTMAVK